ncbi:MAG: UDP-3-O-(3-hydroxymyristoyl)glucosamine N-acyltransferase [Salinivirgaceae bacterium]|nr:UDP-3-O-(3-hydroxymyristoyl)glucosamine N-acyltransferase [Salinivirgaceae bacterium]
MEFTANQIAGFLNGKVEGNGEVKVSNVAKIEEGIPGTLAFLANPKYMAYIYSTDASIVLVNDGFKPEKPIKATLIYVNDAYHAFASLLELVAQAMYEPKLGIEQPSHIHPTATYGTDIFVGAFAYIGKNVKIGDNVKIYPQVYIGDNVTIGDNCTFYAGCRIYHDCKLGSYITIHSGAVIGADGFGFAPTDTANYKKIPQIGNVILEDFVEIGANSTIDRATMGSTHIRKGVKLDNMVHIAHNVEVGENTVMAAQCGIAGSSKIGSDCMFGGQIGVAPHISIAKGTKLGAKSGVNSTVRTENSTLIGAPVQEYSEWAKSYVHFRNFPKIVNKLNALEKEVEELKKNQK